MRWRARNSKGIVNRPKNPNAANQVVTGLTREAVAEEVVLIETVKLDDVPPTRLMLLGVIVQVAYWGTAPQDSVVVPSNPGPAASVRL